MKTVALIGPTTNDVREVLNARAADVRALVFAPDAAAADTVASVEQWPQWTASGRVAMLIGPDYGGAATIAQNFTDLHAAPIYVNPELDAERPDEVARARQALARVAFQATANEGARRASAGRYLLHTLTNAPRLAREGRIGALEDLGRGMPAVIAAAGPSLDRNVHDLSPVIDRALVIACDTAARPLLSLGLEPDFIIATDSSRPNAGHLTGLPQSRSWLVAEGSLHPSGFVHFDRRAFVFRVADHQPWPWLRSMGIDVEVLETWGSVATSAFSLALKLGCDPIVFVGADFAFTDHRPYCRGTSFEPLWATWIAGGVSPRDIWQQQIDRWPLLWETDLTEARTPTASHLVSFRDWIVDRAAALAARRIVNATGAGLLAGGRIEQASAGSVLDGSPSIDRASVHRAIAAAHRAQPPRLSQLLEGVSRLLEAGEPPIVEAWMQFGGPGASAAAIVAALRSHEHEAWCLAKAASSSIRNAQ
jgi:hypothetical protein